MKVSMSVGSMNMSDVEDLFKYAIETGRVKKYKKVGSVKARRATKGEHVKTIINGKLETQNSAKDGDWVVTGPAGEEYIISGDKFSDRYRESDKKGEFIPTGVCWAFEWKGKTLAFIAEWGERMICNRGDFLASISSEGTKPYRIERDVFHKTYKEV